MLRALALFTATISLALAACGGDDEGDFRDESRPVAKRLSDLGEQVQDALQAAENKSDAALARQFAGFAEELAAIRKDFEDLDAPESVEEEAEDLKGAVEDVERSLREIADAARRKDPRAARTATIELIQEGERLDELQNALSDELGD